MPETMNAKSERTAEQVISIAFAANLDFLRHVAVGIASILHVHPHHRLDFRVITTGADPVTEQRIRQTTANFPLASLSFRHCTGLQLNKFFLSGHVGRETYLRLFLAKLLPDLDRILYLDADVVAVDDLRPLFATDLGST